MKVGKQCHMQFMYYLLIFLQDYNYRHTVCFHLLSLARQVVVKVWNMTRLLTSEHRLRHMMVYIV